MDKKNKLDFVTVRLKTEKTLMSDKKITDQYSAAEFLREEFADYDREAFAIVNMNAKGSPINASIVSLGELTTAIVHPREVFKTAILSNAAAIMLMHNHPSGDCTPSREDIVTTERLVLCGQLLGINVIDHIIVSHKDIFSFLERGLISNEMRYDKNMDRIKKELETEDEI